MPSKISSCICCCFFSAFTEYTAAIHWGLVNKEASKRAAEANKLAAEASKIANEEIRKSNVYRLESVFYDDAKARQTLTKKELKKLNELNKKQKELAEEAAKLAKERAKLLKTDK